MKNKIEQILHNKRLVKYFVMAVIIVGIELITFQAIYLLTQNYFLATSLSFIIGVLLNWIVGRKFVFGASSHHPLREFIMVLVASLFGLLIQLTVVTLSVQVLGLYPLIGKVLSIIFSFFWNYWFRARFIYKIKP
jgi:putative flippase GtrA